VRTELHFHLLPGVDDGPTDDAEATELARLAVADGTRVVVATPHVNAVEIAELPDRLEQLRTVLSGDGVQLEIRQGGELSPDDVFRLSQAELDSIAHGPRGRRWVLLEAPLAASQSAFEPAAEEVRARGFGLVLAHPERSAGYSIEMVCEQARLGTVIQINASSLVGVHGSRPERAAVEVAQSGVQFVLASDAHSPQRPPLLSEGARVLAAAGLDADTVYGAVDAGPSRLVRHGLPPVRRGIVGERAERRRTRGRRLLRSISLGGSG
jgi:protein-tyrosine phosphatase